MMDQKTRNNHYVPQWYQKGFLSDTKDKLWYMDLHPESIVLPNGVLKKKKNIHHLGPRSCFYEYDLYTTRFGEVINDDVEKYLFGKIDRDGSIAVNSFINGIDVDVHNSYIDFFNYVDIQKLRTPKGLDWIKGNYGGLSQIELMVEMQNIRAMHCTMWAEGVIEIVSASESDVKFIISDHPVTVFNKHLSLNNNFMSYPYDPDISKKGSQTVFALNANTCAIFTHIEYARDPVNENPVSNRTNARYRGNSLVRTDKIIRSRKLTSQEVAAINYLIKKSATKYIAAANTTWLTPEAMFNGDLNELAQILLPPKNELWDSGGEMFIGYQDGSTHYQDEFGRKSKAHEFLKKSPSPKFLGPEDECRCGSGHIYQNCCQNLALNQRPSWDVYSIRERNLILIRAIENILGLNKDKTWNDVRRELDDTHVGEIYKLISLLWPEDTDITQILPRKNPNICRAVYLGFIDARVLIPTVLCWLNHFDEVVIPFPFVNPNLIKKEFNPIDNPSKHNEQTLRCILVLLILEPFIDLGVVHVIPDPSDFNSEFSVAIKDMADKRIGDWKPTKKDMAIFKKIYSVEHLRHMSKLPVESIKSYFKKIDPDITLEVLNAVTEKCLQDLEDDPYYSLRSMPKGGQLQFVKGFNLETAMFMSMLSGSIIYTDTESHWNHIHQFCSVSNLSVDDNSFDVPLDVNVNSILESLVNGKELKRRVVLRKLTTMPNSENNIQDSIDELKRVLGDEISQDINIGKMCISKPLKGFDRIEVRRLLLTFSDTSLVTITPMVVFSQPYLMID